MISGPGMPRKAMKERKLKKREDEQADSVKKF
jgi:hypothetical protein